MKIKQRCFLIQYTFTPHLSSSLWERRVRRADPTMTKTLKPQRSPTKRPTPSLPELLLKIDEKFSLDPAEFAPAAARSRLHLEMIGLIKISHFVLCSPHSLFCCCKSPVKLCFEHDCLMILLQHFRFQFSPWWLQCLSCTWPFNFKISDLIRFQNLVCKVSAALGFGSDCYQTLRFHLAP